MFKLYIHELKQLKDCLNIDDDDDDDETINSMKDGVYWAFLGLLSLSLFYNLASIYATVHS